MSQEDDKAFFLREEIGGAPLEPNERNRVALSEILKDIASLPKPASETLEALGSAYVAFKFSSGASGQATANVSSGDFLPDKFKAFFEQEVVGLSPLSPVFAESFPAYTNYYWDIIHHQFETLPLPELFSDHGVALQNALNLLPSFSDLSSEEKCVRIALCFRLKELTEMVANGIFSGDLSGENPHVLSDAILENLTNFVRNFDHIPLKDRKDFICGIPRILQAALDDEGKNAERVGIVLVGVLQSIPWPKIAATQVASPPPVEQNTKSAFSTIVEKFGVLEALLWRLCQHDPQIQQLVDKNERFLFDDDREVAARYQLDFLRAQQKQFPERHPEVWAALKAYEAPRDSSERALLPALLRKIENLEKVVQQTPKPSSVRILGQTKLIEDYMSHSHPKKRKVRFGDNFKLTGAQIQEREVDMRAQFHPSSPLSLAATTATSLVEEQPDSSKRVEKEDSLGPLVRELCTRLRIQKPEEVTDQAFLESKRQSFSREQNLDIGVALDAYQLFQQHPNDRSVKDFFQKCLKDLQTPQNIFQEMRQAQDNQARLQDIQQSISRVQQVQKLAGLMGTVVEKYMDRVNLPAGQVSGNEQEKLHSVDQTAVSHPPDKPARQRRSSFEASPPPPDQAQSARSGVRPVSIFPKGEDDGKTPPPQAPEVVGPSQK